MRRTGPRAMAARAMAAAMAGAILLASPATAAETSAGTRLAGPTLLGSGTTIVPIRLNAGPAPHRGARAELVIEGLAFDAPPGALYQVSLRGPNGRRAEVGTISFYNETAPGYGGGGAAVPGGRRVFDATEALRRLGGAADALVFEPTAGVVGPGVRVRTDPAARLRFSAVTLRWR